MCINFVNRWLQGWVPIRPDLHAYNAHLLPDRGVTFIACITTHFETVDQNFRNTFSRNKGQNCVNHFSNKGKGAPLTPIRPLTANLE